MPEIKRNVGENLIMVIDQQPRAFVITITDNSHSLTMYQDCLESAKKFNWKIEQFVAYNGNSISNNHWKSNKINLPSDKKFLERKGVQGCFLSHYALWKKCIELNEPIIILEHDTIFQDKWKSIELTSEILKLHTKYKANTDQYCGEWSVGAQAYIITPKGAKKIIKWISNNFAYHADILIGSKIVNWKTLDYTLVGLNENNFSTTFEKRSVKLRKLKGGIL